METGDRFDSLPDRALYALFARHADADRHVRDRRRYRGTDLRASFAVYLARVYGCSWVAFCLLLVPTFAVAVAVPPATIRPGTSRSATTPPGPGKPCWR